MAEVKLNYNAEQVKDYFYHDKCDKYDYLISVGCGAIAGLKQMWADYLIWEQKITI